MEPNAKLRTANIKGFTLLGLKTYIPTIRGKFASRGMQSQIERCYQFTVAAYEVFKTDLRYIGCHTQNILLLVLFQTVQKFIRC